MEFNLDKTELKIINATIKLIDEVGYLDLTTKKIAEEAGINEVTLFRKFKSKNNLINQAKQYSANYFLERIDKIFTYHENVDIKELLVSMWWDLVNFLDNNFNFIKNCIDEIRKGSSENQLFLKLSEVIINNLKVVFENQAKEGKIRQINSDVAALNIFSVSFQAIIFWKIYDVELKYDLNRYVDDFLDIFLNGISINGGN